MLLRWVPGEVARLSRGFRDFCGFRTAGTRLLSLPRFELFVIRFFLLDLVDYSTFEHSFVGDTCSQLDFGLTIGSRSLLASLWPGSRLALVHSFTWWQSRRRRRLLESWCGSACRFLRRSCSLCLWISLENAFLLGDAFQYVLFGDFLDSLLLLFF